MPNLLLKIKYDGSAYHGWQVQKNALSVQQVLQDSIERIYGERLDVKGCSRTDTGVHAREFCVSFKAPFYPGEYHLISALNNSLPYDIKAFSCEEVDNDFHARYSSKGKEYVYYIYNGKYPDPFKSNYSLHYKHKLNEKLMHDAAQKIIGTHDFRAFCSIKTDVEDTVRTIYDCTVQKDGEMIIIKISGNGFLYNMVRIIAGTLLNVGTGKITPDDIPLIIESKDRTKAGKTLCAKGLFLNKVFYD